MRSKKSSQLITFTVILIIISLCLHGCKIEKKSVQSYGVWNETTKNILQNDFHKSLPQKEIVNCYAEQYYYSFDEALLGDPTFVIYLTLRFSDTKTMEEQLEQYSLADCLCIQEETTIYYFLQSSPWHVKKYLDEEILDGMFYNFEVISIDYDTKEVRIVNAHVWDYYKEPILCEFFAFMRFD